MEIEFELSWNFWTVPLVWLKTCIYNVIMTGILGHYAINIRIELKLYFSTISYSPRSVVINLRLKTHGYCSYTTVPGIDSLLESSFKFISSIVGLSPFSCSFISAFSPVLPFAVVPFLSVEFRFCSWWFVARFTASTMLMAGTVPNRQLSRDITDEVRE